MIKVEIDVNVKGLEFLEKIIGSSLNTSCRCENKPVENVKGNDGPKNWTTNDIPKGELPQTPTQPTTSTQPVQSAPVGEVAYTLEQLKNAAIGLVQSGTIQSTDLFPILNDLGVADMSKLTPNKFNAFAMKLKELGGVI